jgi:hypothetical protein
MVRPTRTSIMVGIEGTVRPADQRPFAQTPTDARPTLAAKVNILDHLDVVDTSAARREVMPQGQEASITAVFGGYCLTPDP